MTDDANRPTNAERERAEWHKLQLEIAQLQRHTAYLGRQHWWEVPRAVAMILLAAAALAAAFRLPDLIYPPHPQTLNVEVHLK